MRKYLNTLAIGAVFYFGGCVSEKSNIQIEPAQSISGQYQNKTIDTRIIGETSEGGFDTLKDETRISNGEFSVYKDNNSNPDWDRIYESLPSAIEPIDPDTSIVKPH